MASSRPRKTADGKRYYEITVSPGRSKQQYTRRWYVPEGWGQRAIKRQLEIEKVEFERQVKAGEHLTRKEKVALEAQRRAEEARILTVKQFGEQVFMAAKENELSENSRASYRSNLNNWVYPTLGDVKLIDVTPAMISSLLLSMQKQGKSQATRVKVYNILNGLFQMAFLQDSIPANPMLKVQRPKKGKSEENADGPEMLTADELNTVFQALEGEPLLWQCYVHFLADSGCRRGEVRALCWSDIDWNTGAVNISKSLNYTKDKGVYVSTTKNGHSRTVFVGADTLHLLTKLRTAQANNCVSKYCSTQHNSPEPLHPQSPTRYLQKLSARTGLNLHPHIFRHTFASLAIQSGADVLSVSQVLGHSSTSVTLDVYGHASDEAARKAAAVFREAVGLK